MTTFDDKDLTRNSGLTTENSLPLKGRLIKLCRFYGIDNPLTATSLVLPWRSHEVIAVRSDTNQYIFKRYAFFQKNQVENIINTYSTFINENFSFILPLHSPCGKQFYRQGKYLWLAFPYLSGEVVQPKNVLPFHIKKIVQSLMALHAVPLIEPFNFPELTTLQLTPSQLSIVIAQGVNSENLYQSYQAFQLHRSVLNQQLVFGHGDLRPANVIWQQNFPTIIDWDQLGAINRMVDLFNTAINWAGIETTRFSVARYRSFIQAYARMTKYKIIIDEAVISASLGSWLAWLVFLARQIIKEAPLSQSYQMCQQEIAVSERALRYIWQNLSLLVFF